MKTDYIVSVLLPISEKESNLELSINELIRIISPKYVNFEIVLIVFGENAIDINLNQIIENNINTLAIFLNKYSDIETAISAGLNSAIGDFTIIMDILYDPIIELPTLLEYVGSGCDILIGVNIKKNSNVYVFIRKIFLSFLSKHLHINITPDATGFQILSRAAVNAINNFSDKKRKIRFLSEQIGFKSIEFKYKYLGNEKSLRNKINDGIEIIIRNSSLPLLFASRISLLISFVNFFYIFYVLFVFAYKKDVMPGWTTTSLQNSSMYFFLFLVLSIISEYISKIMSELNSNQNYIIRKEINNSELFNHRNILK